MSDNNPVASNAQTNYAPPMVANLMYIKDFSVENPAAPAIFATEQEQHIPKVSFDFSVGVSALNESVYEVEVKISTSAFTEQEKGKEDLCLYIVELTYAGVFSLSPEIEANNDAKEEVLYGQCAAVIYPHASRIVMDAIRDAGYAPPMLSTAIDLVQAYKIKKAEKAN